MNRILAALLAALILAPLAQAHVTITADSPSTPIPAFQETAIPVTFSANCAIVLAEYEANGNTELTITGGNNTPAWLAFTGDKIPFKTDMCDTTPTSSSAGNVVSTGNLYVTPGAMAPAGRTTTFSVLAENEAGEASVFLEVAAWANLTAQEFHDTVDEGNITITVPFNITTNAALDLSFSVDNGTAPANVTLANPLLTGSNTADTNVSLDLNIPEGMDTVERTLTVTASYNGTTIATTTIPIHLDDMSFHSDPDTHDDPDHDHESPGVGVGLLVVALVGFAVRKRE